jgi:hypothetical protein
MENRKSLFKLALSLLLIAFSIAYSSTDTNSPAETAPKSDSGKPRLVLKSLTHDLGEVGPGTKHDLAYEFKNEGDGVLKISRVHAPCGCTVPTMEKMEYLPGESGKIDVKFTAPKSAGPVTKNLYIYSNDPESEKYEMQIKCSVIFKVKIEPEVLDLAINKPNAGAVPVILKSLDNKEFSVVSIDESANVATFDFDKDKKAATITLNPTFDIEKLKKNLTGTFIINLSHPDCSSIMLRYTAPEEYVVSPQAIIQTKADPGKPYQRTLWITSNYTNTIAIESITSQKDTVKIINKELHGNRCKIDIELNGPKEAASSKKFHSDELYIKVKDGPKLTVRCQQWFAKK